DATDEQARASGRVVTMVDEATEISEETNAETETVAAAAEEQTATVSEVATGAQSLTEMADDLRNSLDAFDVTEEDDAGSDTALESDGDIETDDAETVLEYDDRDPSTTDGVDGEDSDGETADSESNSP
ncbi:methyl-accepting chemotaxis protein, partial [Natrarchaeobius halalkaliphilus]